MRHPFLAGAALGFCVLLGLCFATSADADEPVVASPAPLIPPETVDQLSRDLARIHEALAAKHAEQWGQLPPAKRAAICEQHRAQIQARFGPIGITATCEVFE